MTHSDPKADPPAPSPPLDPRLRRILELVYRIEGVAAARIWQWDQTIAIGVRATAAASPPDLLRQVETAVAALREPGEAWDFGLLEES